jgi:hypothetical protein
MMLLDRSAGRDGQQLSVTTTAALSSGRWLGFGPPWGRQGGFYRGNIGHDAPGLSDEIDLQMMSFN